jgi:hypothetical protein
MEDVTRRPEDPCAKSILLSKLVDYRVCVKFDLEEEAK